MNLISIKGRLTHDPELRKTDSGKSVCSATIAVNRRFQKDMADFFDISAWGKTGELIAQHFTKGQEIVVWGEMQSRKYENKEANKRTAWAIRVDGFDFCGNKSDNTGAITLMPGASIPSTGESSELVGINEDDLPF